jgi:hypothetical protein
MKYEMPNVLRARGFRLYLANGKRIIDLWLNGGAAVLGHTPPNMLRELKNTASRGLYAPFPHFTEGRLYKALLKLFPENSFRLYAAPPAELINFFKNQHKQVKFWRPYTNPADPFTANNDDMEELFIPILPGIQTWRDGMPFGLCVAAAKKEEILAQLPPGDTFSPILLAVAARGIHDLLAAPHRAKTNLPRIAKALKNNVSSKTVWKRRGIYLTLNEDITRETWAELHCKFLEAGFLLPPNFSQNDVHPLILPGEMSDGEEAKLASILSTSAADISRQLEFY